MKQIFCFATGNIWRWYRLKNREVLLEILRGLDISGVELTFSSRDELFHFELSPSNLQWLRSLDYVSIHAPFGLFEVEESHSDIMKQINVLASLYRQVNARNTVIHPQGLLHQAAYLKQCRFQISTENMPRDRNLPISFIKKIFRKYPRMKLCLDVAHAYFWSKHETGRLVRAFGDRISQIHFSATYRRKDHQSLRKISRDFEYSIQPVLCLDVPVVIEEDIERRSMRYLKEEIKYIKGLFE